MEGLIPVVNKLQDVFNTIGQKKPPLDLPQIVVIGSQSSGKSSVLENIVGKGFLPRGAGICTRRPLVLQLYHSDTDEEWAEFLHVPNRRFTDFDQVRREIEIETDRETGKNKGVSNKAIRLKVYSPNVLNLTLVDLPGITKVPVGDQPGNIEELIRDMCLEYVSNPLSIILAVSPANADLANSDALKLAREVDPAGDRTIGVLTKLDLVDDGVDALDALNGKVIPLKRGYIGIVNRSQSEINANLPLKDSRRKEQAFFLNHPSYRSMASRQGTEFLTKTLNTILLHHIREHLPDLKANVQKQLRDVERELAQLGSEAVDTSDRTAQGQVILALLSRYAGYFVDSMEGRQPSGPDRLSVSAHGGLYGGARLARAFKLFADNLMAISAFQNLSDGDIGRAIMNATGPSPSLFVPEMSFEVLVKQQLTHLQDPAIGCVSEVYEILHEVADQSCYPGLSRFGGLKDRVVETVHELLFKSLEPTQSMIKNLICIEQAFINTSHPDFANKLHFIRNHAVSGEAEGSGSSVTSRSSEPTPGGARRNTTSSLSLEMDGRVTPDHMGGANGSNAENLQVASNSDDETALQETTKRPNFMSFIFNERVATSTATTNGGSVSVGGGGGVGRSALGAIGGGGGGGGMQIHQANGGHSRVVSTTFAKSVGLLSSSEPWIDQAEAEADSQIQIIKRLIDSYLQISRKNILDLTPKTIMFFLVNNIKENLHTELIRALYKEELFDDLLKEDEEVAMTRANFRETAKLLGRALAILNEVREYKLK